MKLAYVDLSRVAVKRRPHVRAAGSLAFGFLTPLGSRDLDRDNFPDNFGSSAASS